MDNSGRGDGSESWDAMLDSCIYYYMNNNNMRVSAEVFAQEANLLHLPPDGDESLLTDWWPIFWDAYCAKTRENSGPSSSLVQPGNVTGNAQQSIHGKAPVVIDQPVLLGADMDTMLITGQQPAAHLMASSNYQGQQPTEQGQGQGQEPAPPLFEIQAAEVNQDGIWMELEQQEQAAPTTPQDQRLAQRVAQAQDQRITQAQARAEGDREARERALEEAREAEARARNIRIAFKTARAIEKLQAGPSITKVRSRRGQSSTVAAQTQHQGNRDGASRGRSIAPGNEASAGPNNYQGQQPAEAPAQGQGQAQRLAQGQGQAQRLAQGQGLAQRLAQYEADREARSQARAISRLQAGASSINVSSQQVRSLTVAAQTQHQVPPSGNRDGESQERLIAPGNEASTGANQQRSEEADVSREMGGQRNRD